MKKILFIITFLWVFGLSHSQVATNYTFSQSTGTYVAVTLGTQLVTTTAGVTTYDTDGSYITLSSGNRFTFNGTVITSVNMTADGALWLNPGTSTTGNASTGAISSSATATGIICPLNMDLRSSSVAATVYERRWYDDGTEDIFQWQNCARYLQSTEKISFQIRINKSTGVIRVVYGSMTVTTSTSYQPYVGLRGSANTDFNNRRLTAAIPDASPGWAGSTGTAAGTTNAHTCRFLSTASCFPPSGLIFIWTPKPVITPSVSTLSAFSSCSGSASSIQNFTVAGTNMLAGITITPPVGFEVSTSSTFASSIGTSSSALVVGSAGQIASTTIYVRLQSTASTGTPSGNITLVSTSATTKNVAVSGNVGVNLSAVVVSSSTTQSICLGSDGTSVSVAETGGGTITARQWGRRSISGGVITNVTGTSSSYTPLGTDFTTVGTYYLVCTSTPTCGSATVSNEVTITIVGSPATPGIPTTNSPQCISPGVTLTANGSAPAGETWYWQTTSTGVATTSSSSTYVATTTGTYYIRSVYTSGGCWGVSNSAAIVISTVPLAPSLTSPTTAATGVSLTPTLTWGAVVGSTSYDVYIGTTLPGSPTANVLTNSYSPSTLLNGTTYSWKVIAKNECGSGTSSSTFTFTTVIVNDNSVGAIDVPINSGTTCTTTTTGTSIGATQTLAAQLFYGTADDDVWYKFTSTASSLDFSVSRVTIGDLVWELYNSSLVSLGVIDAYTTSPETASLTGSIIGDVYYIRVYSYASTVGSRGTFTICITTPTQPPSNDNASGSITLIINDPYITGTNDGSTASVTAPTPTGPAYYGADIWYKVVVPTGGIIQIRTSSLVLTDAVMEVYSGSASALTYITYNDDSSSVNAMPYIQLTGRTPGETIWIRIWDYLGNNTGTFNIRASIPVVLPITLISFTGHNTVDGNSVEWKTASEVNNDYFTLERGTYRDGSVEWLELQFINGAGNSNIINTYGYFDLGYPDDINYYQLTQTDYDGNSVTYDMISIDNRINGKIISSITNLLGQEVNENYRGLVIITYIDGSVEKIIK